jgi:hypothetical protein
MPRFTPPSGSGGIDGTLSANRVSFASDSDTLTDDADFTYDATNDLLNVTKVLTQVVVDVHNATGSAIPAGTPVYVTGSVTSGKPNVEPSDANNAATMPSVGIVTNNIGAGSSGYIAISGLINGIATSVITDVSPAAGDILYVSTTVGELTTTKPTGTDELIQNVGRILEINGGNFKMTVNNLGRTNDTPNALSARYLETVSVSTDPLSLTVGTHAGRYLIYSGSSGTVNLPSTSTAGEHYTVLNVTGGDITIGRNGNNINGAASDFTLGTYNGATAIAIGSNNWVVLG